MPREHEAYRDNLEALREYFLPKRLVNISDVARYLGCDRKTAIKRTGIDKNGMTIEELASALCKLKGGRK